MNINDEHDKLGKLADTIDNILAADQIPMPLQFKHNMLVEQSQDWSAQLKQIYINITGDNPWDLDTID